MMQLNSVLDMETVKVLFEEWEKSTGVKAVLIDSEGTVLTGSGTASEEKEMVLVDGTCSGYLASAATGTEETAKADLSGLMHILNQMIVFGVASRKEEDKSKDIHAMIDQASADIAKINDITRNLDKIEKNQKILALNASIEAARAGEAGRGFAIVATNVSTLATDFGNNNREIKTELEKLNSAMAAIERA